MKNEKSDSPYYLLLIIPLTTNSDYFSIFVTIRLRFNN